MIEPTLHATDWLAMAMPAYVALRPMAACRHEHESDNADAEQQGRGGAAHILRLNGRHQDRADAENQQHRAAKIDLVLSRLDMFVQIMHEDRHRRGADRQIDPEHEGPVEMLDDERAEDWPGNGRKAPDAGQPALNAGPFRRRIDVADDRRRHRLDRARSQPLDDPEDNER